MLRYFLKFDGDNDWTEVGSLVQSTGTTPFSQNLCSTAWRSTTNEANFTLMWKGTDLYTALLRNLLSAQYSKKKVECKILVDGEQGFIGFVNVNKMTISSKRIPDSINVFAEDHIILLDEKIRKNHIIDGSGKKMSDVVDWCMESAGLPKITDWQDDSGDENLEVPFVVTEDDDFTYRDRIDTILQELGGYVLVSEPTTGGFIVRKVNNEDEAEKRAKYVVASKLTSESTRFSNDGVVVKFHNVKTSQKHLVYYHNVNLKKGQIVDPGAEPDLNGNLPSSAYGKEGVLIGEVIAKNGYFPTDGDITKTYQEYDASLFDSDYNKNVRRTQNSDMGIYYVKPGTVTGELKATDIDGNDISGWYENSDLYSEEGRFTYDAGGKFYPRKAWQLLHNKSDKVVNVVYYSLEGVAVYTDQESRVVVPDDCKDPFEYDSSYISKPETAFEFSALLYNIKSVGGDTSKWTGKWDDFEIGEKAIIQHKKSVTTDAVIVKKTMKVIGGQAWCDYIAVMLDGWKANLLYELSKGISSAGLQTPYDVAKANGFVGTEEEYMLSTQNTFSFAWSSSDEKIDDDVDIYTWNGTTILINGISIGNMGMDEFNKRVSTQPEGKPFLWMKINDGSEFRLTGQKGEEGERGERGERGEQGEPGPSGEDAKSFVLKASSYTYLIDKHSPDNNIAIDISWDISGYSGSPTVTCITNSGWYNSSTSKLTIPKNTTATYVTVEATLAGAQKQTLTVSGIDVTSRNNYFGTTAPGTPVEGDAYFDTTDNLIKTYLNGRWGNLNTSTNQAYVSEISAKAMRDALSRIQPGTLTQSDYAYFNTVIAGVITADYIGSKNIILNGGSIQSNGYDPNSGIGFRIDSSGESNFRGVNMVNGSVTGAGQFDCPSFSSMPKRGATQIAASGASARDLFTDMENKFKAYIVSGGYFRASQEGNTNVAFIRYVKSGQTVQYSMYDSNSVILGGFYNSNGVYGKFGSVALGNTYLLLGGGDVFKFKEIPRQDSSSGLEQGQVYSDSSGVLHIVL